ncbi:MULTISPECIES: T9SS type A sorting domain-containing protein [Flavobacterium]|nr:T9SS type A sorting domain-containing protein [Flavobacterium sp. N1846]
MKKVFILLLILIGSISHAQKLSFQYDSAGNQIVRQLCLSCSSKTSETPPKEVSELQNEDLKKFSPEDVISYYPNPVKEQLYLKWDLINNIKVVSINLYSLTGQLIKTFKNLENENSYVVSFYDLPDNVYSLNLVYSNGEQKPIKIIKK